MSFAQKLQFAEVTAFDEAEFNQDTWELADWREQKTRHIALHIAKLPLKIIGDDESRIVSEVIPDMALYRTQLIQTHELLENTSDVLMGLQFPEHIDQWSKPVLAREIAETGAQNFALKRAAIANAWLAHYLEPLEHGGVIDTASRQQVVLDAVSNLHIGAVVLAKELDIDVRQSLRERIQ